MAAKKVLFLHHGIYHNRGSEKVLLSLLSHLDRKQFEPLLICNNELFADVAKSRGIETIQMAWPEVMMDTGYHKLQFFGVFKTILKLRRLIIKESIDLLVCNSGLTSQTGHIASRITKIPCVSYIHSPFNKRYIYLYGLHKANLAIFVSSAIKTTMTEKVNFDHSMVIHNGIDTDRFKPVEKRDKKLVTEVHIDNNVPVIGQVGSLVYRKGVDILIKAARILRDKEIDFHIVLAGCGSEETEFRQMVCLFDLQHHVTFLGNVDPPDILYQHLFDINVLASHSEAFGLTLAEGAACGLPCVGSNAEGIPEVIDNQESGLLFEPGNSADLADKLEKLLKDSKLREKMGQKGREYVMRNFAKSNQVNQFNEALQELVTTH